MSVDKDDQGHPTLKTTGCSLSIGHLGITFHGGASWLYNLFNDQIADAIKSSLQGQVYKALLTIVLSSVYKGVIIGYYIYILVYRYVTLLLKLSMIRETRQLNHCQVSVLYIYAHNK